MDACECVVDVSPFCCTAAGICGYHVYKEMWEAAAGEVVECVREPYNVQGLYAVAVKKLGTITGHLPWRLSRVCLFFLRWGGTISCTVIDWEEKILRRSAHLAELTFVYCAQKCMCYFRTVNATDHHVTPVHQVLLYLSGNDHHEGEPDQASVLNLVLSLASFPDTFPDSFQPFCQQKLGRSLGTKLVIPALLVPIAQYKR